MTADAYGDHQVGCGGNGDRIHRHDSVHDAVFSAAQSAALVPRKEAPSVIPGSSSRSADTEGYDGNSTIVKSGARVVVEVDHDRDW